MRLRDILQTKGYDVHTIHPSSSLADVVRKLVERNCGSLVVTEDEQMVGIITERDILRVVSRNPDPLDQLFVRDHMTRAVLTGTPDDEIGEVMGLMTTHRVRHLPITAESQLVGIISIGDVVKAQHDQLSMENHYLKNYIQG